MGVYVFRAIHGEWVKLGHHLATRARPNPYYRIAGRGFAGCVHPPDLEGRLWVQDLELVAWYPSLTAADERRLHLQFAAGRIGEFHGLETLPTLLSACDAIADRVAVTSKQRNRAMRWGWRRVRKARRRAGRRA